MDETIARRFVTRDGDFSDLLDFPPEYRRYRDDGCKVARSCLDCPFAGCLEEGFHGKDISNSCVARSRVISVPLFVFGNWHSALFRISGFRRVRSVECEPTDRTGAAS